MKPALKNLFSNRYADAFVKTLFLFGVFHLGVLSVEAVRGDVYLLNAFRILNLDLIVPGLGQGAFNLVLSYGVVLVVYCIAYRWLTRPTTRTG